MKVPWMPVSIFRQYGESDCQVFVFWVRESLKTYCHAGFKHLFLVIFINYFVYLFVWFSE